MLVNQVTVDIFFIDWEKPRGKICAPGPSNSETQTKTAPVSMWRTYFVANEWNELQTIRNINPTFQLFATLFFLKVCENAVNLLVLVHLFFSKGIMINIRQIYNLLYKVVASFAHIYSMSIYAYP